MHETTIATENYINSFEFSKETTVIAGGSLGRREMLPMSDIDLFVVGEDLVTNSIKFGAIDKFELGKITKDRLKDIVRYSLVDGNRLIDGRVINHCSTFNLEQTIQSENTPDRQFANIISEYFYFRYFDYSLKRTSLGPNLKYSIGSSRDIVFYNWVYRLGKGALSSNNDQEPELEKAISYSEDAYGIKPPINSIDLILIVKNAAMSRFNSTNDPRVKYCSTYGLNEIYRLCKDKFNAMGIVDAAHFYRVYSDSRLQLEDNINKIFRTTLLKYCTEFGFEKDLSSPNDDLLNYSKKMLDCSADNTHSSNALASWIVSLQAKSCEDIDNVTHKLINVPLDISWGGIMAVVCSPYIHDDTLNMLTKWLYANEHGAYLLKLVTRSPNASTATKMLANSYYKQKEIIN